MKDILLTKLHYVFLTLCKCCFEKKYSFYSQMYISQMKDILLTKLHYSQIYIILSYLHILII